MPLYDITFATSINVTLEAFTALYEGQCKEIAGPNWHLGNFEATLAQAEHQIKRHYSKANQRILAAYISEAQVDLRAACYQKNLAEVLAA